MRFLSTRGGESVSAAESIVRGICPTGGLYVPERFPALDAESLVPLAGNYRAIAYAVMSLYLEGWDGIALRGMIERAYESFDTPAVTPVTARSDRERVLELWHGPTMAFKDVALQMLPYLMTESLRQTGVTDGAYILVATSGDTGKAALEGFCDVPGTRVLVFYPDGGVSRAQRLQMVTQEGANVDVCAVRGNFDDAQTGVKRIFASHEAKERLAACGCRLSSANSINFGRLLPQIVYYYYSYATLRARGVIAAGEKVNFCVPTGNFGDILAGWYAKNMGLPVNKLICASNRNNVLTDFFRLGVYDKNRPFHKSMSCSIDILISSNLERLLFALCEGDCDKVRAWMAALSRDGRYALDDAARAALGDAFYADWCDEADTLAMIRASWISARALIDPHTAVAQTVYERYRAATGDTTATVLLSTANPYKFATDVLSAFEKPGADDFENAARLSRITGTQPPAALTGLLHKPERFTDVCALADMQRRVLEPVARG